MNVTDTCMVSVTIRTPEHFTRKFKNRREYLLFKQDYFDWCDRYMIGSKTLITWKVPFEEVELVAPDIICYCDVVSLLDQYMEVFGTRVLPEEFM